MSKTCEYRETQCFYCLENISMKDIENHQSSVCRKVPLNCPNECGVQGMPREQMNDHLIQCPLKKTVCPFSKHGCTFEGTKDQLDIHKKDMISLHLDMTMKRSSQQHESLFLELKTTMDKVIRENARIPELIEENERLQKETQANKISIQEMKKFLASNGEKVIQTGRLLEDKASVETVDKLKKEVITMKDTVLATNQRVTNIEHRGGVQAGRSGGGNSKEIENVEKQVGLLDIRLCELDLRLQLQETINFDGVLMWKIREYNRRKREAVSGKTLSLYSQPFYTSRYGYKLCGRVYLNGDGAGKGLFLSFFLVVMRGDFDALLPWPFQLPVTLKLLDQNGTNQHVAEQFLPNATSNSFQKPTTEMNVACGVPCFAHHSKLETDTYLKDDTIFLRVVVDCTNARTSF
ncbi:TNF receptor-associated factor 3-like [Ylistrum balloti]|nr:TNF receptor-associated factor 3-like [Ylistrum balloti]